MTGVRRAWTPAAVPVLPHRLQDEAARHPVMVVHCWADWNEVDRLMDAVVQRVAPSFREHVAFRSLDTGLDLAWGYLREWEVMNLPGLVCLIEGKRHETLIGLRGEGPLRARIREWLSAAAAAAPVRSVC